MTDGRGVPLGLVAAGANVNDYKLTEATLQSIVVERPHSHSPGDSSSRNVTDPATPTAEQGLCLDAGYFREEIYALLEEWGYTAHIRPVGSGQSGTLSEPERDTLGVKARRWVVERTHSWLNRFRGLLIRWCKKGRNYLAMLHLACGLIAFRAAGLLG